MTSRKNTTLSRRLLLGGSLAGVAVGPAPTQDWLVLEGVADDLLTATINDPVLGLYAEWTARRQTLEELIYEWQRLERLIMARARKLGLEMDDAVGSRFPEVTTMEVINRSIHTAHGDLDDLALHARRLQATSAEGALAKIGLGLGVQGPYNWEPNARELVEGGLAELRLALDR